MTTALTTLKKVFQFTSGYSSSVNIVPRFPVLLGSLLSRMDRLAVKYGLSQEKQVFDLSKGKAEAMKALKGKGGIYVLHNKTTGLFYVGSAQRYFDKEGRLNDYFLPSRVSRSVKRISTKVSYDLAIMIQKYGMDDFTLITVPVVLSEIKLKEVEQTWMLLLPTINRSLSAKSNNQGSMSDEQRESMSNKVYIYEMVSGAVVETLFIGIKRLRKNGVVASNGVNHTISYNTLTGHLASRTLWKDQFLFSTVSLPIDRVASKFISITTELKSDGVWVYDFNTKEFISHEATVRGCQAKYNISRTHFKRVRKFRLSYNGYLFSNKKLD